MQLPRWLRPRRRPSVMIPLRLVATGAALPHQAVSSSELDAKLGREAGATLRASGVSSRYLAGEDETQSQLGAKALQIALKRARLGPDAIDLLVSACAVQEQALPSTACAIAEHAQLPQGTPAFDVNASCLSFLVALAQAATLLSTGIYRRIAIVSADLPSRGVDWNNPHASSIFGDGAAALIVEQGQAPAGLLAYQFNTYPTGRRYCEVRAGGTLRNPRTGVEPNDFLFQMNGSAVFRLASEVVPPLLQRTLAQAGLTLQDIDTVVPHQASRLAMDHLAKRLKLDPERVVDIYNTHGNQVAASMPTALDLADCRGMLGPGKHVLLLGTAAGLSAGAMVLRT